MFVPQFAAHLLPGPSPPPEPAPPAPPPDPRSLSHRAALRSLKCAECLTSSPHLDSSRREALRRFSVFPGLSAEHRAFAWRVMLGFSHAHADLRAHEARNRLHMYRHFLVAARAVAAAVAAPREEPPVVAAFRVYCAMYRYQDAVVVVPLRTPAPRALLPTLLSETDLACLDAMRSVLRTVYGEEGREEEEVQCDVFWALVGITGQQRRTAYSAAGQYLQTYGVRQKVMAYAKTLAVVDPELNHWIESRLQLSHSQYAEQWFRSLFSLPLASANRKDPTVLPRLWDALIASPFELICNVGVGLVRLVRHKIMDRNGGGRGRPLTSSEVLELLSNLPCVTAGSIELLLSDIWVNNSVSLFHRGRHIDEVRDNPRSYAPVEWPLLDEHAEADPRLIRTCQYLLRARGVGAFFFVDGTYGPRTKHAVRKLRTSLARKKGTRVLKREIVSNDVEVGSMGTVPTPMPSLEEEAIVEESVLDTVTADLWPKLIETLALRSKHGFAVKALQTALEMHGFPDVRVDGFFGALTHKAVIDFQKNHAANLIEVDGVVGPLTWLHLVGVASPDCISS